MAVVDGWMQQSRKDSIRVGTEGRESRRGIEEGMKHWERRRVEGGVKGHERVIEKGVRNSKSS